jgi:DNA (cytosine-5)-methyltransferase 1
MKYLSVCSGIEAATVAWHDLGWTPVAFSEIEPFPSAVLKHHYPHVPNVGDMTKFKEWNLEPINLLVGGTPCQSFSVAGLRKGLDDPRGNLMLTFLAIAERERPKWIVWENVPGVLSSNGGRDFGTFLGALGELGYGWAYRVLDAQWFGVAQRRRRVFVVGCLGDQAGAAAVLFESESVCRNPAPSREKGQGVARGVGGGPADGSISGAVTRKWAKGSGGPAGDECYNMVAQPVAICTDMRGHGDGHTAPTLRAKETANDFAPMVAVAQPVASQEVVAALTASGRGVERTGESRGQDPLVMQPITFGAQMSVPQTDVDMVQTLQAKNPMAVAQPVAFKVRGGVEVDSSGKAAGKGYLGSEETAFTLAATQDQWIGQPVGTDCYNGAITGEVAATIGTPGSSVNASGPTVMQAVDVKQVQWASGGGQVENDTAQALRAGAEYNYQFARVAMQVRRLTPTECERLQGFPDGYTNIPWRKKDEAPDGPRYKALGNSMAVPCMKWIGERIQAATARQEVQP